MENNFEVVIFPLAQADMEEIFNYISNNLKNKILCQYAIIRNLMNEYT